MIAVAHDMDRDSPLYNYGDIHENCNDFIL